MDHLPPPDPRELAFLTLTTTGQIAYDRDAMRNHRPWWRYWQFMFTLEGRGQGEIEGTTITAERGTAWLMPKDRAHSWGREPGAREPWVYRWLEFDGEGGHALVAALGFDRHPCVHDCGALEGLVTDVVQTVTDGGPGARWRATARLHVLLAAVASRRFAAAGERSSAARLVARAQGFLAAHLDQAVTVEAAAERLGVTPAHLIRCFRRETAQSPMRWLTRLRAQRAMDLLATEGHNVSEVGAAVGYPRVQHFSRMFKRETGLSPRAYLRGRGLG